MVLKQSGGQNQGKHVLVLTLASEIDGLKRYKTLLKMILTTILFHCEDLPMSSIIIGECAEEKQILVPNV